MTGSFGSAALVLFGLAARLLGWRPAEFWGATPAEFAAALSPRSDASFDRADLERLMGQSND